MKQTKTLLRPCTWVYVLLMGLTFATWLIGTLGLSGLQISLLVLGFALLKGQLIGDYFMGLKQVSGLWRWAIFIWLALVGTLVSIAFITSQ